MGVIPLSDLGELIADSQGASSADGREDRHQPQAEMDTLGVLPPSERQGALLMERQGASKDDGREVRQQPQAITSTMDVIPLSGLGALPGEPQVDNRTATTSGDHDEDDTRNAEEGGIPHDNQDDDAYNVPCEHPIGSVVFRSKSEHCSGSSRSLLMQLYPLLIRVFTL
jgi:hypothetical protein